MCLSTITHKDPRFSGYGYKVFLHYKGALYTPIKQPRECNWPEAWQNTMDRYDLLHPFPLYTEFTAEGGRIAAEDTLDYYKVGFHIFMHERDAIRYMDYVVKVARPFTRDLKLVVRKVSFREAIVGTTSLIWGKNSNTLNAPTFVAKYMTIEEEV